MESTAPQSGAGNQLGARRWRQNRAWAKRHSRRRGQARRVHRNRGCPSTWHGPRGGLLFLAGLAAGLIKDVPLSGVAAGLAVIASGLALLLRGAKESEQVAARWEIRAKERIVREVEEKLRPMTPKERLRFFVPHPEGFARPPWMLDGLKEPFRQEVNESLLQARREEGEEV